MLSNTFLTAASVAATFATVCSAAACATCKAITVDVAVLGGGAAGTYVAAQLNDIHGKTVVVVDTASRLGGHVDTVRVPGVDHPIDFGVMSFHNLSFVQPFFNRYNVSVVEATQPPFTTVHLDSKTAKPVNVTFYSDDEQMAAIGRWTEFGLKYKKYVYPSYNLPSPLGDAAPLARPFIETIKELQLESIAAMLLDMHWSTDLLALPTLHAVSTFGYAWLDGTAVIAPESKNNTQLYANIQAHLGDRVLLNSRVTSVHRSRNGTSRIAVDGPGGCTHITAKQIVVGFVPTAANMAPFDTTRDEKRLFEKFSCVNLHNGLVRIDGYPDGVDLDPISSDPARFFVPAAPTVRFINFAGTPYTVVYVVNKPGRDTADAKKVVEARLKAISKVGTYNVSSKPEYIGFSDHTPDVCSVSPADMAAGFWTKFAALQGELGTSYVGQAQAADLTAYVWAQAQEVVDRIVKKL